MMSCTRRDFLKASLGASALLSAGAPNFLIRSAMASAEIILWATGILSDTAVFRGG